MNKLKLKRDELIIDIAKLSYILDNIQSTKGL